MAEIVVGVDGSDSSQRALEVAMQEAARRGAVLRALHSWHIPPVLGSVPGLAYDVGTLTLEDGSAWAQWMLDGAVATARRSSDKDVAVVTDVRAGDAGTELVSASKGADLLVVGARSHGALVSALIGSASNYVLHHAHCPVLIVPGTTAPVEPWRRVVVGVDGSECADEALRWAATQARRHACPLVVVHAWMLCINPAWFDVPPIDGNAYGSHVKEWLTDHVRDVLHDLEGLEVETRTVQGTASSALIGASAPEDLLVVGTHGRGGFSGLVMGSVALQCVHHARSAVAVLRATASHRP